MDHKIVGLSPLQRLRAKMQQQNIDIYLIVSDDFHASEYVGDYFKCREYISGFDGSAGTLLIMQESAGLWTDGRYFLQAETQLQGTGITLYKMGEEKVPTIIEFLKGHLENGMTFGYDGRTIQCQFAKKVKKALKDKKINYQEHVDLVGEIWEERPELPAHPIWELEVSYVGMSREDKLSSVREKMKDHSCDCYLLASLDDIAWLYNLRGNDIAYNPVFLSYTLVKEEEATLYVNENALSDVLKQSLLETGVTTKPYLQIYEDLKDIKTQALFVDESTTNVALMSQIPSSTKLVFGTNPTKELKAVKSAVEIENERIAHQKDGVAVTKLICWLKKMQHSREFQEGKITELLVSDQLLSYRKQQDGFIDQSFAPIIATGAHGAIVHYEPTAATDISIEKDTFLLMDTGGQYYQGTTDITRTVAIGSLTMEQKQHYTAVLRGHINLARARFKYGCAGANLDILAREPLWELCLDYNHGTGHGVGYLLNVHEGPNGIRQKDAERKIGAIFEEGMITSNEPGLYLENQYGIRLENLILCQKDQKNDMGQFMRFETLTLVPFDREAILPENMSEGELSWLNAYHQRVYEQIASSLDEDESEWLYQATRPIKK